MRIAVVAAHGVLPRARYTFGDQVATALQERLSAYPGAGSWTLSVVFPHVGYDANAALVEPTLVRVHRPNDDPAAPVDDVFDVYEVYWSPFVRGKTNAFSVVRWLLRTALSPMTTTARCRETPLKAVFDAALIASAVVLAASLFGVTVATTVSAYGRISALPADSQADEPHASRPPWLRPRFAGSLAIGWLAAYLFGETLRVAYATARNARELGAEPVQLVSRLFAVGALCALSCAGFVGCSRLLVAPARHLYVPAIQVASGIAAARGLSALLGRFFVNFFGPVQVYMTRDENDALFDVRERVLGRFVETLRKVIRTPQDDAPYDRVFVLAHSLGSTIALDAMLRLLDLRREGAVAEEEWQRIRGFLSFGTSLEKTKYFFDAMHPSLSQRFEQWRNDLSGSLFTAERRSLDPPAASGGIYWLNCWYFSDIIADAIASYRSFLLPGERATLAHRVRSQMNGVARTLGQHLVGRIVAENRSSFGRFRPWHPVTHEDYLDDPWFWLARRPADIGVLDVITSGLPWNRKRRDWDETASAAGPAAPAARYESVRRTWWRSSKRVANRSASAAIVKLGFAPTGPGITEPSAT